MLKLFSLLICILMSFGHVELSNAETKNISYTLYGMFSSVEPTGVTFTTLRNGSGLSVDTTNPPTSVTQIELRSYTTTDKWIYLRRSGVTFNTSSLVGSNITSARLYMSGCGWLVGEFSGTFNVVSFAPASPTSYTTSDWSNFTMTQHSTAQAIIGFGGYFQLNSTGLNNINKLGYTTMGVCSSWDINNSPPSWLSNKRDFVATCSIYLQVTYNQPSMLMSND